MAAKGKAGMGAVFLATSIVFALAVLIGIFYWMIHKPQPVPHSPERPNIRWNEPSSVPIGRRLDRA